MGPEKVAVEWAVKGWRRKWGQCRWSASQHRLWTIETPVGRLQDWLKEMHMEDHL